MAPYACSLIAQQLSDNYRELHDGGCKNYGDNACSIHLQRDIGGLAAHHFPSLNLLCILDRDFPGCIIQDYNQNNHGNNNSQNNKSR